MSIPEVTIVIPHFSRPATLLETLKSVQAQTFQDWEALIVDDASPEDPTAALSSALADPRIRLIRLARNAGPSAARNAGIAQGRGRFVAFLDSDDLWLPTKLEAQLADILAAPDPDGVISTTRTVKLGPGTRREVQPYRPARSDERFDSYLFVDRGSCQTSAVMLGREAAARIGFDAALRQFEDYLFFIRAGAQNLTHVLTEQELVIWKNDDRPDRLSHASRKNMANAWSFLAAAGDLVGEDARLAFIAKHLGVAYVREEPGKGLAAVAKAVARGLLTPRHALAILANGLFPPGLMNMVRRLKR